MMQAISASRLCAQLGIYFVLLFGGVASVGLVNPELLDVLPLGGTDALEYAGLEFDPGQSHSDFTLTQALRSAGEQATVQQVGLVALFLASSLGCTLAVMFPIAWTYSATRRDTGFRKNFLATLMLLPICAATVVLLIQNSLALAFGLAAMVAAVRFRVTLDEAIDGIYIFASVCIGLAAGIGYLGIAAVMSVFFCFVNVLLWWTAFGQNPVDEARDAKKRAKIRDMVAIQNSAKHADTRTDL